MQNSQTGGKVSRAPYGKTELSRLIAPKVVAVVGATPTPGAFGKRTLENVQIGFTGKLYAVNPRYENIDDIACFPSIRELPQVPDCVVLAVPQKFVEPILEDCAALGVGGAIVYSSGFSELGTEDGLRAQARFAALSRESGLRICGPNCVGIINLVDRIGLTFMPNFCTMPIVPGSIGLVSQSGALGYVVLQAMERGIGFSHYLSPGNSCDADVSDMINYLVEDEATKAIACTFEGVSDGARLQAACCNALKAGKPLITFKLGNNEISRRTAMSHTGTLIGQSAAYRAVFEQNGAVMLTDFEQMLETASFFAKSGTPKAHGVGIMTSSGGAAVMGADKAAEFGLDLPAPAAFTVAAMNEVVPSFGSTGNPSDITAESLNNMEMYGQCIKAFDDDPSFGAVVAPMMSAHNPTTIRRAQYLSDLAANLRKPLTIVWLNEWYQGPGSEVYDISPNLSMFRSMGRCLFTVSQWLRYHNNRPQLLASGRAVRLTSPDAARSARAVLAASGDAKMLTERGSKEVLAAYGIPVTRDVFVRTLQEALAAAASIGYPVVLKGESATIAHKSDAGIVHLNLRTEAELRPAYQALTDAIARLAQPDAVTGIVVQNMIPPGQEMLIGVQHDIQFGPTIACGFGGTLVEVLNDTAASLAPLDTATALRMIKSLKGYRLLQGYRGQAVADVAALAELVVRISELAADLSDVIAEIDVNPVIIGPKGGIAGDARIVRHAGSPASQAHP